MVSELDHITITAPTLLAGAAHVAEVLGVPMQAGGEHPRMGTHNLLLRLGERLFLEVIAPNPAAPAPNRPRWFGLDALTSTSPPCLSTWVVRTPDIQPTAARASEALGPVEPMSRGALNWHITIPADGALPLDGCGPALIQWHTDKHPALALPDQGVSLLSLVLHHPEPARVERLLASLALVGPVRVAALPAATRPCLSAQLQTPCGVRVLGAPIPR